MTSLISLAGGASKLRPMSPKIWWGHSAQVDTGEGRGSIAFGFDVVYSFRCLTTGSR